VKEGMNEVEKLTISHREHREKRLLKDWLVTGLWVKKQH
jgi:hypothetical protein